MIDSETEGVEQEEVEFKREETGGNVVGVKLSDSDWD